jgi:signal peptidase I
MPFQRISGLAGLGGAYRPFVLAFLSVYTSCAYVINNVAEVQRICGQSMSPYLSPDFHEFRLVDSPTSKERSQLQRGMIVSLWAPHDPERRAVKRVIGIEGDVVTPAPRKNGSMESKESILVPWGHVWVEGDNQEHSLDSNDYGPISKSLITGVATHILWPPGRRALIDDEQWDRVGVRSRVKEHSGYMGWPKEWAV